MAQQIDIVANLLMKVDGAEAGINKLKNSLSKLKMPEGLENSFKKSFANLDVIFARYRSQVEKGFNTKADVTNFAKTGKALDAELDRISKHFTELTGKQVDFKVNNAEITKTEQELTKLINQRNELAKTSIKFEITGAKEGYKDIESLLTKLKETAGNTKTGQYAAGALDFLKRGDLQSALVLLDKASVSCKRLNQEKQDLFSATGLDMSTAIQKIVEELTGAEGKFGNVNAEVTKLEQILADLRTGQIKDAGDLAKRLADDMLNAGTAAKQADDAMQDFARSSFNMTQQLGQLQQSTQYFFSLRNMINLLKRGLDDAIQSVKELDKAMTETAVVTEFDVSDMWAKLPEYTTNANALGATIQDMYESTTLYYQQGLNTQQAMEIATETMKMARIAGLEAKDATDMMTAALRGFNMELDEASATRINDVYSNLAAKTASDTKEIGTAMQRTASIAHSAGMSFEGTAAFLAQAIETTREPAENLGTAMKTIVARFTELKKNPLEIVEVDGEEVSYNKVDTALQSIGVSLKDANGQFRALDEVFLDISKKWDGLSQTQQRYVATMAAGSRQQSRFIAMMSDYGRTVELMSYANDSAGASQEQFNKTMESFEAKIHQLQNAWQRFTMGIANEKFIKGAVDGLTNVLTIVNNIIDKISGGNGLVKSLLSVATAFMGLKTGGRIINKLIGGLGGLVDPTSNFFSGFKGGAIKQGKDGVTQAKAISDPIVQAINRIYGVLNKSKVEGSKLSSGSFQDYSNKQTGFRKSASEGASVGQIFGNLEGLDKKQISTILNNNPGIEMQLQRTANQYIKGLNLDKGVQDLVSKSIPSMFKAFKNDPQMSPESFVKAFRPDQIGKSLIKAGEPAGKQLIQGYANDYKQFFAQRQQDWAKQQQDFYGRQITPESHKQLLQSDKQYQNEYNQYSKRGVELFNNKYLSSSPILQPTKLEKAAQGIGAIGAAFGTAGMAVSSFGNALSSLGLEKAGKLFTNLGNKIASVGSIISSVAMTMNQIQLAGGIGAITSAAWFAPLMTVMGAIAATGLLVGGSLLIANKQMQKIKESAEDIIKTFEETNEETKNNIASLKQYQTQAVNWAKGVDINGNNINLSDDDYNAYLEAIDKIAELNPEIVQGYNAQGHAILNINDALKETIALQEKEQKRAFETYTSQSSLESLLAARNISTDYYKNTEFSSVEELSSAQVGRLQKTYGDISLGLHFDSDANVKKQIVPLKKQTQKIAKELQQSDLFKQDKQKVETILDAYGINFDDLLSGEKDAVNRFVNNQDAIQNQLSSAAEKLGVDFKDSFNKSFETLGEDTAEFEATIEPIYQNLVTRVSNSDAFKNIAPEFQSAVMSGLKEIAKEDLSASDMIKASNALIKEFDNLTSEGSAYATAMGEVEKAQDQFAQSLDAAEYAKGTENALETLNQLMEQYAGKTDSYSQAIAEYLQNQIERIKKFTEEGAVSLTEALNEVSSTISAAEGAYDSFKESTKSDFSTGASSMKSIYEEVTKETDGIALHMEKRGDNTFWTGARALLGDDFVEKNGDNINKVKQQLKSLEPMLQEGEAGYKAFHSALMEVDPKEAGFDKWLEINEDGSWKIDTDIEPEGYKKLAEYLGMSEEFLVSMLNKGRQFQGIDFNNIKDVRTALATDEASITNGSNIFVKSSYLNNALSEAGYVNPADQKRQREHLSKEGIIEIKNPDQITKKDFESMGIKDLTGLIKSFGDTGQFNRDEITQYAQALSEQMPELDITAEDITAGYDKYLQEQEHPEIEPIQSIESTVAEIAAIMASNRIEEGHIDNDQRSKDFQRAVFGEAGVRDTMAQKFSVGKGENGQPISADEYKASRNVLLEAKGQADAYINELTIGLKNATGKEKELMQSELDRMTQSRDKLKEYIDSGDKAFKAAIGDRAAEQAKQAAIEAGASKTDAMEVAAKARAEAEKTGQEITQEAIDGYITGLKNDGKISAVNKAGEEAGHAYTDTGTKNTGAKQSNTTATHVVTEKLEGKEETDAGIQDTDKQASEGATHVTEFTTSGQKETEGAIKRMTDAGSESKTVKVGASVDSSATSKIASAISGTKANIPVGIKDNATAAAEKVRKSIDRKSATIDVKVKKTGISAITVDGHTWNITAKAKGQNNYGYFAPPSFGSAAKGRYGQLGPKGTGGLTLTGELGYEIAWLPSENRSMILGANGPQMVDLPGDAVIWNHEQSKEILKKNEGIPFGSMGSGDPYGGGGGGSSGKKKKKKKKKKSKKSSKKDTTPTINNWSIEEAVRYNIDQSLASITEEISLRTKEIEKNLEKIGTTYNDIVGTTQAQIAALDQVKKKNQELLASNQRQLADYRSRQQYVSWTDGNGESQRTLINIASYLNADGSVNTGAIAGLGSNRALQEAVYKEISSAKSIVDGINNANKAIKDADEQIADLGKKVSEAFYQWENELTEVYSLTQRINNEVSFTNRFTSQVELELSKLNVGFGDTAKSIENAKNVLTRNNATIQAQIKNQQQMIAARQRELEAALSYEDEVNKYKKLEAKTDWDSEATKTATLEWAKNLETGARLGYKYVADSIFKDIDGSIQYQIDWEKFNADNEANPYSKADYEAIKKYLDDLNSAATEFNDSIKEQTDFIKQTYDALREYQDYISDMEDTLIKGVEEEIEEAKNNAKQLSDSITGALKDLLDEVKRKLDERRKQEDNAKTERDISQKQQRLAALRADTAGGHQVEIAQLEKEIADSQQSYQRTLEDQLLDRLQQQADAAAQQRERQIELAETGNQIAAANNKELVDMWLRDPVTYKEQIRNAWLEANGYDKKGEAGQYVLENQFESDFAQLVTAVEETNFTDHFNELTADTNSLLYTLEQLTNGQLGRYDELSQGQNKNNALLDATERNTTSILTEIQKGNLANLRNQGVDANTLKSIGYDASTLINLGGYQPNELQKAGFTAKEVFDAGITDLETLKNAGYDAKDIKSTGAANAQDLKGIGFTATDLKDLFSLDELIDATFDAKNLKDAGFDAKALRDTGKFTASDLRAATYTAAQLKAGGYNQYDLGAAGYGYNEARALYGLNDLKSVTQYATQANQEQAAIDAQNAWNAKVNAYNGAIYAAHARGTVDQYTLADAFNKGAAIGYGVDAVARALAAGDGSGGVTWKEVAKAAKKLGYGRTTVASWSPGSSALKNATTSKQWKKYAIGGLADYTGPAWLDGTPSKPELVLNAKDTQNFLVLRDVLSSAMKSTGAVNNSYGGDATYEININVDHLNNDYDVDRVAERVKKIIVKDSSYRNVTQVRNLR